MALGAGLCHARGVRPPSGAAAALLALLGCATPSARPPPAVDGADPRAVLDRFAEALDGERWDAAYALLSPRWRARATPARLASDLAASGAVGRDAVARVRALLAAGAPLVEQGAVATLAVGEGKAARLVREGAVWRVDALE
jgi:hypothetical protein